MINLKPRLFKVWQTPTVTVLSVAILISGSSPAQAQCANPVGAAGDQMYNSSFNVMQYCDGTDWTAMRGPTPDSIDWDDITDTMTLDATTTIDMDTNTSDLNFDSNTFVIDSSANALGIGIATPDASAIMELSSTNRGFLAPRVSDPTSAIAAPATGLIAYNTATNILQYYDGTAWRNASAAGGLFIDDLGDAATDYVTDFNMFMGDNAGASIAVGGQYNLAIGQNSGDAITTGDNNIAIGYNSLTASTITSNNIAIGANALDQYNSATDGNMVAIGANALGAAANGRETVAIGSGALGSWNAAPSNSDNTAVGASALTHAGSGAGNVAMGRAAGAQNTVASYNVFVGVQAGSGSAFGQTGIDGNVFVGASAGGGVQTGAARNIAIGRAAGNPGIGNGIGAGTDNILIGHNADVSANGASNELNIGDAIFGNLTNNQIAVNVTDAIAIDASAILQADSTDRGFLAPRVSDPTSAIAAPATGLIAYNTVTDLYQFYDGTSWVNFNAGGSGLWTDNTTHITRENFHVLDAGLAAGSTTAGLDGDGTRAFFDPDKGAMRGGAIFVADPAWQDANIGNQSFAWGANTRASNSYSIALGSGTTASGSSSTAMGNNSTASGASSTAMGENSTASNFYSTAMGRQAVASGQRSVAAGDVVTASGYSATAIGSTLTASGYNSIAFGYEAIAGDTTAQANDLTAGKGNYSVAFGLGNALGLTHPRVTGNKSFGVFLGNQQSSSVTGEEIFAILGEALVVTDGGATTTVAAPTSAVAQFDSDDKGFLAPRVSDPTSAIAAPATGLIAYNTVTDLYEFYDGTAWRTIGYGAPVSGFIDDLGDAATDYVTDFNMFMGDSAGANTPVGAQYNIAIGQNAFDAAAKTNTADNNIAIGYDALSASTTSSQMIAIGSNALESVTTNGRRTIAIGTSALQAWTGPATADNTVIGDSSYVHLGTGHYNTSLGYATGISVTDGDNNVLLGYNAGGTTPYGQSNIDQNVFVGSEAGRNVTTNASRNIAIGYHAGSAASLNGIGSGTDNILIGYQADVSANNATHELNIGDLLYGNMEDGAGGAPYNQVGINVTNASAIEASAVLQADSNNLGFLAPRISDPTSAIAAPATGLIAYNTVTDLYEFYNGTSWVNFNAGGTGLWTDNTTHITRENFHVLDAGLAAGSTTAGLDGDGTYSFYDPDKGAMRGGTISAGNTGNQDANVGVDSFVWGLNNEASGVQSAAIGESNIASGQHSFAGGFVSQATGIRGFAFGHNAKANATNTIGMGQSAQSTGIAAHAYGTSIRSSGWNSMAFGFEARSSGSRSIAFGAGDPSSATSATYPNVSGNGSFGVFFGDQDGSNITGTDIMALLGGSLVVNDGGAGTIVASPASSVLVEFDSTDKGFLAPRISDPTSAIAAPATGLIAYNTVTDLYEFYDGTAWRTMGYGAPVSGALDDLSDAATDYVTDFNMFMGQNAGDNHPVGAVNNIAIGPGAFSNAAKTAAADHNIAIGRFTLQSNSSGNHNVAIGTWTLEANTTGFNNVGVGDRALRNIVTGSSNVALGKYNLSRTNTGENNTAIGDGAIGLATATLGDLDNNTAVGYRAGYNIEGGAAGFGANNNLLLGYQAGDVITTGDNNVIIGYDIDPSSATTSYELNLGGVLYGNIDDPGTGGVDETQIGVGVAGATAIDASAILQADSRDRGLLVPRVSDPTSAIAAPATGLVAYDTSTNYLQYYDGTAWRNASAAGGLFIDDLGDATTDYITDFNMFMGDGAGASILAGGQYNLAIGQNAGDAITTGDYNIAIGHNALTSNVNVSDIIAIGPGALNAYNTDVSVDTTAEAMVAIGKNALATANAGRRSIAIGDSALANWNGVTSSSDNIAIGTTALVSITTGSQNLAIGNNTGISVADGSWNTILGNFAGGSSGATSIIRNTFLGFEAGNGVETGASRNIAIGNDAGSATTLNGIGSGTDNILIGYRADVSANDASYELNIGDLLYGNMEDGAGGAPYNQVGINVTNASAIEASAVLQADSNNLGFLAPRISDPTSAIAAPATGLIAYDTSTNYLQYYDGTAWQNASAAGGLDIDDLGDAATDYVTDFNMFMGDGAGASILAGGQYNLVIGQNAGDALTTGDNNIVIGYDAGTNMTTATRNVSIGQNAGFTNVGGGSSVRIGYNAGYLGSANGATYIGDAAGYSGGGDSNTAVGSAALYANANGTGNVAVGSNALRNYGGGAASNIGIGFQAGDLITTGGGNIIIGTDADPSAATASYELNIGNSIFGNLSDRQVGIHMVNATSIDASAALQVDGNYSGGPGARGFLPPRMSDPNGDISSPAEGLVAYDLTDNELQFYNGTGWASTGGYWTDNTTHITRENFHVLDAGLAAGSTTAGLDGDGRYSFYDPDKGALRGGSISGGNDAWENANIGTESFAWGTNTEASGIYSVAIGNDTTASGYASFSIGENTTASGSGGLATGFISTASGLVSTAIGVRTTASGYQSFAFGNEVRAGDGTPQTNDFTALKGNYSVAWGLGDSSIATYPQVTGNESFAMFFGDQQGEDITATNVLALEGGSLLLSNDSGTACDAAKQGALRLNAGATGLEMCDGAGTWDPFNATVAASLSDTDGDTLVQVEEGGDDDTIRFDTAGTERMAISPAGNVGIGITTAASELQVIGDIQVSNFVKFDGVAGNTPTYDIPSLALNDLSDVSVAAPSNNDVLTWTGANWVAQAAGGLFTDNTTHITRENFHIIDTGQTSTTASLDGDGRYSFYDPDKGALRGGSISGGNDAWEDTNVGVDSFAWGADSEASADYSVAIGASNNALAEASIALGTGTTASGAGGFTAGGFTTASGDWSTAMGILTTSSGYTSLSFGHEARAGDGTAQINGATALKGNYSVAWGLGDASTATFPQVTGNKSFGVFMGDQESSDITGEEIFAILGEALVVTDSGAGTTVATPASAIAQFDSTDKGLLPPRVSDPNSAIASPATGLIAYDTSTNGLQFYNGTSWTSAGGDDLGNHTATTHLDLNGYEIDNAKDVEIVGVSSADIGLLRIDSDNSGNYGIVTNYRTTGSNGIGFASSVARANAGTPEVYITGNGRLILDSGTTGSPSYIYLNSDLDSGDTDGGIITNYSATYGSSGLGFASSTAKANAGTPEVYITGAGNMNTEGTIYTTDGRIGMDATDRIRFVDNTRLEFDVNGSEHMRLTSDGFLGINMTNPSVELDVTGDIEYTGTITDVSDKRLKTDIHSLSTEEMVEKIAMIDTYSFKMKDDKKGQTEMGVMAQDIEKIFPELVKTANDEMGTKSVNYMGLIAPMIEATKALKAQNENLSAQMASLQSDRETTQASLESLNKQVTLLNKAYLQGNMKEASFANNNIWILLLLGFLSGGFLMWTITSRHRTKI